MNRLDPITLADAHVRLEPLAIEHAEALCEAANAARGTFEFTLVPRDPGAMREYVARALDEQARGESVPFVVRDATGSIVGSTRYMAIEYWSWAGPPAPPVPRGPDALEIGATWYAERVQRTAVNTAAKLLLCRHAFEDERVRRVTWKTDARNARSRAAIARLGAQFDGVLRAHRPAADGGVRDTAFYSMLACEWPDARRALEARLASGANRV